MKIKFLKPYKDYKKGRVVEVEKMLSRYLINVGIAKISK